LIGDLSTRFKSDCANDADNCVSGGDSHFTLRELRHRPFRIFCSRSRRDQQQARQSPKEKRAKWFRALAVV
jgi:hypothetical protein